MPQQNSLQLPQDSSPFFFLFPFGLLGLFCLFGLVFLLNLVEGGHVARVGWTRGAGEVGEIWMHDMRSARLDKSRNTVS